ncbi:hypothetical protein [Streptantibioticus ferralitis]|uniref:Uncharacterized protein n=1 Tax=Streptantibioticus ferralitis TaxID=236510 RepID=A0ABT5ZAY2_9ACTN|nr:hypothetical protein [Streptantibioticus ferralitis]MDF2260934.1 hypothetical protein [Streptantibioticus ferralitis]
MSDTPRWPAELAGSIESLKAATIRSRSAFRTALRTATALRSETDAIHINADHHTLFSAIVLQGGAPHHPYAGTLAEVAFSHHGLAMSLSRVWNRAAYAYAYGTASSLLALHAGQTPRQAAVSVTDFVPSPATVVPALAEAYEKAAAAERTPADGGIGGGRSFDDWAGRAEAWHHFADAAARKLWLRLCDLSQPTTTR